MHNEKKNIASKKEQILPEFAINICEFILNNATIIALSGEYSVIAHCFLVLHSSGLLFFGHHFRVLLIPTFMVVTILI